MKRVIVAFTGLIGSGKTTAAMHMVLNHDYRRVRFAGPLKDMARAFGLSNEHIEGRLKEQPCHLLGGKTPRYFMQALGTEFGRNLIDPDLWIRAWEHAVCQLPEGVKVVSDDCRFPNEAEAVKRMGSVTRICRIVRVGAGAPQAHVSELQAFRADYTIENSGSIEEFYVKVDALAKRIERSTTHV